MFLEGVVAESVTGEKAANVGGGVAPRIGCESKDGGEAPREESSREDIGWPSCEIHGRSCESKCAAEGQKSAVVAEDVASRIGARHRQRWFKTGWQAAG